MAAAAPLRPLRPARPRLAPLALLAAAGLLAPSTGGYVPPAKFLIVSNARNGTIGYVKLSRSGKPGPVRTLVDDKLLHPQGLAVDQKRQLLLVADSELRKVVSYGLMVQQDGSLTVDEQTPVAEDVETRWVAVDGLGNVYMTDEDKGQVFKVSAGQVLDGDTRAKPVEADHGAGLSAPGGVATDNFHVYWTNKESGDTVGTVMKALHTSSKEGPEKGVGGALQAASALAKNLPKAYGLCLALDNVFFTGAEKSVFVVKQARRLAGNESEPAPQAEAVEVTAALANPRGCAWDGEATVFVADRSADAVYALPGPMTTLLKAEAEKVLDFEGAFGVAVFSAARGGLAASPAVLLVTSVLGLVSALTYGLY